jgi:hypothetical protein
MDVSHPLGRLMFLFVVIVAPIVLPGAEKEKAVEAQAKVGDPAAPVLAKLDSDLAAIRTEFEKKMQARVDDAIKELEAVQKKLTRDDKLDEAVAVRDVAKQLKAGGVRPEPNPGNLTTFRDQVGKTFYFEVTGSTDGALYGTDSYTADSWLAAAAVHSGALKEGEKGVVRVRVIKGASVYSGSTKNGVTSNNYTSPYEPAYLVERATVWSLSK